MLLFSLAVLAVAAEEEEVEVGAKSLLATAEVESFVVDCCCCCGCVQAGAATSLFSSLRMGLKLNEPVGIDQAGNTGTSSM